MSLRYLFDTNHVSFALRAHSGLRRRLRRRPLEAMAVAAVVVAELEYSTLRHPQPARWDQAWRALIEGWPILPFDALAAVHHARLRHALRHQPIGERDLLIAAIALANDLTVVTNNLREFKRVTGLRVEDWSVE